MIIVLSRFGHVVFYFHEEEYMEMENVHLYQWLSDIRAEPGNWMEFPLFKIHGALEWREIAFMIIKKKT